MKHYLKKSSKAILGATSAYSFDKYVKHDLGYPFEKHMYMTKDGYINSVFRIPGPKGSKNTIGIPQDKI